MSLFEEIIKIKAILYKINEKEGAGFENVKKINENIMCISKIVKEHNDGSDKAKEQIKGLKNEFVQRFPDEDKDTINEK